MEAILVSPGTQARPCCGRRCKPVTPTSRSKMATQASPSHKQEDGWGREPSYLATTSHRESGKCRFFRRVTMVKARVLVLKERILDIHRHAPVHKERPLRIEQ